MAGFVDGMVEKLDDKKQVENYMGLILKHLNIPPSQRKGPPEKDPPDELEDQLLMACRHGAQTGE